MQRSKEHVKLTARIGLSHSGVHKGCTMVQIHTAIGQQCCLRGSGRISTRLHGVTSHKAVAFKNDYV